MSSVAQICALTNHAERNHRRLHRITTADSIFTFLSPAESATSPADAAGKLLLPETTDVVFFAPSHLILPFLSFSLNSSSLFTNNKLIKHRHCHYWHTKHLLLLLTLASKIEHSRWTKKVWMHIHSFILFFVQQIVSVYDFWRQRHQQQKSFDYNVCTQCQLRGTGIQPNRWPTRHWLLSPFLFCLTFPLLSDSWFGGSLSVCVSAVVTKKR